MKKIIYKIILLLFIAILVYLFYYLDLYQYLTLEYIKLNQARFANFYRANILFTILIYFGIYIITTALSLPGATILTMAGGAMFGLFVGTIVVSFASTIGATLAFMVSRFLLFDYVQNKFKDKLETINRGIEREGAFYLFTLRLIPAFPFFLINLVMGLTPIKTWIFFLVSQVGMLLGTMVYVNAGVQLAKIDSLRGILSWELILSFTLLGIFPLIAKKLVDFIKRKKVYKGHKKPKKFDYNMIVIGAGSAGLVTSYICALTKAKVALIEKNKMGGDCLNHGCVPSKALLRSAKIAHYATRASELGVKNITVDLDFAQVMERVQKIIKKVEPHDSTERYQKLGVDCISGNAKIISPWKVKVNDKILTTKNITLATGATPRIPPINGIEKINYLTSETIWKLRELPKKFLIIGGGPIGLEMSQAFCRLGSEVTIVHRSDRLLNKEDPDISELITSKLQREGVKVLLLCNPKEFKKSSSEGHQNILVCQHQGEEIELPFDQVLIATGRRPNIAGYGLEDLKIKIRNNQTIETNEFLQTNYPNIYTCGDVTGPYQLTHIAAHQAWYCAVNGLFSKFKKFKVDYRVIPWCTYTDPEVATVGLNETTLKKQRIPYEVTKYNIDDLDRAIADSEDFGMVKVITEPGKDKILGATIIANHASELLLEFVAAMKHGFGLNKILGTIHPYPSMGEANKYLAGAWKMAKKPDKLLRYVEKYHKWQRGNKDE